MTTSVLDLLACPLCGAELRSAADADELRCTANDHVWHVRDGIPRLVPPDLPAVQERTAEAFGFEWTHFVEQHPEFEAQFLDWIEPLTPASFEGKTVLDAGCGTGRHAYFAARYRAERVVGLDLSDAVDTARRVLAGFENVAVIQGDLLRPPFKAPDAGGGFDLVYSIGVLHHLPDPRAGFLSLVRYVKPGGTIAVWVYGHENNGVVRNVVEPIRRVTTRIPPAALRPIALPFAAAFHGAAKGVYRPLRDNGTAARVLPLHAYMASVGDFSFRQNYAIVYDQLVAPTAAYIRGEELREWFETAGLTEVAISHRHGNSWRGSGRMPE